MLLATSPAGPVLAQAADPDARVMYVDHDPVAVAHSDLMLLGNDDAAVVQADMREPDVILGSDAARRLLDFDQPIGLLMLLMLHWVPDDADPRALVARYRDALAPGSYLAVTHATGDNQGENLTDATDAIKQSNSPDQVNLRSHAEITRMFDGFDLVDPGLVGCGEWRPGGPGDIATQPDMNMLVYAGVGRKR